MIMVQLAREVLKMTQRTVRLRFWRAARDSMAGLVLFVAISGFPFGSDSRPGAVTMLFAPLAAQAQTGVTSFAPETSAVVPAAAALYEVSAPPEPVFRSTSRTTALWVLAAMFAALAAFNLAFLRHVRRAYVHRKRLSKLR